MPSEGYLLPKYVSVSLANNSFRFHFNFKSPFILLLIIYVSLSLYVVIFRCMWLIRNFEWKSKFTNVTTFYYLQLPTMAIEKVYLYQNTSVIPVQCFCASYFLIYWSLERWKFSNQFRMKYWVIVLVCFQSRQIHDYSKCLLHGLLELTNPVLIALKNQLAIQRG